MSRKDDLDGVDVAIRWTVVTVALAFVVACVVTLLTLWTENEARAADVTPQQARDILAVAYGAYTGPPSLLDDPPKIHIVAQDEMCRMVGLSTHCPIKGMYLGGEIYLASSLDFSTIEDSTVLLHEYIHHFQEKTRGPAGSCQEAIEREYEAYRIQAEVLVKAGKGWAARVVQMAARQLRCAG